MSKKGISKLLSRLQYEGKLVGTISAAKKLHWDRVRQQLEEPVHIKRKRKTEIPLSCDISTEVSVQAKSEMPRVRNWTGPQASKDRGGIEVTRDQTGVYGGRKKYPFFVNRIRVTSYGYAFGSRLYARIRNDTYKHEAPRGYVFGTDHLGIYITAKREGRSEYRLHLLTHHVQKYSKARIRRSWLRHSERRLEAKRQEREQQRVQRDLQVLLSSRDFHVTAEDSRAAGNCMAGTLSWGKGHGLAAGVQYPAKVIAKLAYTHPSVPRVLLMAAERTLHERKHA